MTCIKKHRQNLLASVETEKRLNELANWRESSAFSDQEKVALCLSEILSLHESEELSPLILEEARRHFSAQEIVRLALTIIAVNEWIDLQASSQAESAEVFTQDEIARQREDDLAETHFTVAAREEAEVNEGGPDDPTASSR